MLKDDVIWWYSMILIYTNHFPQLSNSHQSKPWFSLGSIHEMGPCFGVFGVFDIEMFTLGGWIVINTTFGYFFSHFAIHVPISKGESLICFPALPVTATLLWPAGRCCFKRRPNHDSSSVEIRPFWPPRKQRCWGFPARHGGSPQ